MIIIFVFFFRRNKLHKIWKPTDFLVVSFCCSVSVLILLKGIVHFEINFGYVLAYLKGIQDVVSLFPQYFQFWYFSVKPVLSVSHAGLGGPPLKGVHLKEHAQRSPN